MNTFQSQSNTQQGDIMVQAASDLTGLDGRLVKLQTTAGVVEAAPSAAIGDNLRYLLVDPNPVPWVAGAICTVRPLSPDRNVRIKAKDAGVTGDKVICADPGTAADAGKIRKLPTSGATAVYVIGIAEHDFADGDLALIRPLGPIGPITN